MKPKVISEISLLSMRASAEGMVLLRNMDMLPFKKGDTVAVFGRTQLSYYKSGTGSGGMVNTIYTTNILDALMDKSSITIDEPLAEAYRKWEATNPADRRCAWGADSSQPEMPLSEEQISEAAARSQNAVVVIGRTAGEDRDNTPEEGSYYLARTEDTMLHNVRKHFARVAVVLNVSNLIDTSWADKQNIDALLYVWHGGQDGGTAIADVLCGDRYPSGKLSDTAIYDLRQHPAYDSFLENSDEVVYSEDIFVGYRYFETFTQSNVQFPFGFGLSYTRFRTETCSVHLNDGVLKINVKVTNIGDNPGKEVVQVYFGVSNGEICRAARELAAFEKTDELKAGESQNIEFSVPINRMRAFDDLGKTGHQFCFVLEAGTYAVYVGTDVRTAEAVFSWSQRETKVVKQLTHRFGLNRPIKRMNGTGERVEEIHAENYQPKMDDGTEIAYTGNVGITLVDVYLGRSTMERFIAQLSDFDLACLSQGEGMNSPKVRPGTGGAIGGLTDRLRNMEIPAVCVTDGPSGLRVDNGDPATSLPNGTLIACTWNRSLVRALYVCEGKEAKENRVDALLGPGLNIHRFPLCGRNFEYLSEDPFLTGEIGTAICEGLYDGGVTATIKHFAANNREDRRYWSDSVVSERALREIYLRPFEIVLKSNKVCMIMTAYNQLNGVYCSANYDLAAGVLREEWGFQGLVMTDWGAKTGISIEGKAMNERVSQILSQNDVYMVNENAETVADTLQSVIRTGILSRAAMQRNAMNICRTVMRLPTFLRMVDEINQDKSMA